MLDCWNEDPSNRPTFDRLHEITTTFVQEEVIIALFSPHVTMIQARVFGVIDEKKWSSVEVETCYNVDCVNLDP